ncbi:TonB family protein [Sphingomonas panni]|uniref:TonB family protein n=1 Tax=Sphingomonas panni TaxID=237612 RepID=UPI001F5BA2CD|nr:TonB family protein [Sphingomonas panni]
MSIASLALLLAANTVPQPVVTTASTAHSLGRWNPGPVRCGETVVAPVRLSAVQPWLRWGPGEPTTVTLQFRIDSDGRPLSIRAEGTSFVPNSEDIAPALAASTFAPGTPHTDCRIDYRQQVVPLAQADPADLIAYSLAPTSGPLRPEGWERIRPADTDCLRQPRPAALLRAYPDFRKLPGTPGERQWSMTSYDLDAKGRPVAVRTTSGTGNTALDAAARKAVSTSRFTEGKRQGCLYPYSRAALRLAAPVAPDEAQFGPTPHCPAVEWAQQPRLTYPEAWNRRRIEGWAVVQFDVAPWGEVGNTRVLASEPAEAFGQRAMQVVRSAKRPPSPTGASGCIKRVRFAIRPDEQLGAEAAEADMPPQ